MIIAWNKETDEAISPERAPVAGEWCCITEGSRVTKRQYFDPVTPDPGPRIMQTPDFLDKLAVINGDALGDAVSSADPVIKGLMFRLQSDPNINLDSPILDAGLDALVTATIISSEDKTALLA